MRLPHRILTNDKGIPEGTRGTYLIKAWLASQQSQSASFSTPPEMAVFKRMPFPMRESKHPPQPPQPTHWLRAPPEQLVSPSAQTNVFGPERQAINYRSQSPQSHTRLLIKTWHQRRWDFPVCRGYWLRV